MYQRIGGLETHEATSHPSASSSISAVIPTYNRGALVERAIESAFRQLHPPDEVIVVDDGSTDDTVQRLAAYGDRVRLIRKSQGGVGSARNLGVEHSRCDFIAFLDSDDLWEPSHLLRMDQAIRATEARAGLYFSDMSRPASRDSAWEAYDFHIDGAYEIRVDGGDWLFESNHPMFIPASVIRRDVYLATGGSEIHLACRSDTHLFFKLGLSAPICAVAGCASFQTRDDPISITTTLGSGLSYLDCTLWLYEDLLKGERLTRTQRKIARRRLASAQWDYAKHHGSSEPLRALAKALQAIHHDPAILPQRSRRRLTRCLKGGAPGMMSYGAAIADSWSGGDARPSDRAANGASATDDFSRMNGALDASWEAIPDARMAISAEHVVGSTSGIAGAIRTGEGYSGDQFSQIELSATQLTEAQWIGPAVRAQNAGLDAYVGIYFWNNGSPQLRLYRRSGGIWVQLGNSYECAPLPAGTRLKLIAVGSRVALLEDGVERIAVSDGGLSGLASQLRAHRMT